MNIWAQLVRALKGDTNEGIESLLDTQAISLLDKEVRVASAELKQSRGALTELMAKRVVANEQVDSVVKLISEHEQYALKALEKGDETLALEVAEKIASLEADKAQEVEIRDAYQHAIKDLQRIIKQAELNLKRLKQQIDTIKAMASVQRAQATVAGQHSSAKTRLQTAQDALERLKERQSMKAAQFDAVAESDPSTRKSALIEKLEEAGIKTGSSGANEVLNRLKNR
ncbi:PspA/IM30 family protein [Reinekea marina]|uniref:PspA/IM30 family protein n=1 Tax=Reinekea marina TaxID=1310421 RepID=A0ABV7WSK2_9GAMM|nr:PspA/IM30 family protein [Reinekea marina]MDN3648969.1 PspA/IM30 family protein [Reinekea marina]